MASDRTGVEAIQPVLRHLGKQGIGERRGLVRQLLQGREGQRLLAVALEGRLQVGVGVAAQPLRKPQAVLDGVEGAALANPDLP